MKNLFHFTVACFACAFSLSAQDDQISYSYDQSQTSSQAVEVSKNSSGQGFSVVLHTKALPSMGSPEEIFAELNKLISQKTVVPLEQRYPGIHVKVKDEDLEYDRLYFDQSDDGEKVLIRMKIRGELIYSSLGGNSKLGGVTSIEGMTCTWFLPKDRPSKSTFWCQVPSVEIKLTEESDTIRKKLNEAHEKQHQKDLLHKVRVTKDEYKTLAEYGMKANLAIVSLDPIIEDKVAGYKKKAAELDRKIKIVMEARAMSAEAQCLNDMSEISDAEKRQYKENLARNSAEISVIRNGGTKITSNTFDEGESVINLGNVKGKKITVSLKQPGNTITYGEVYTQLVESMKLTEEETCQLLEELVKEQHQIAMEIGNEIYKAIEQAIKQGTKLKGVKPVINEHGEVTGHTVTISYGNNAQQSGSIRGNDNIFVLLEKLFIDELNKAYTGPGEPTSEEAMNYFRSANPILEKISVTNRNRAAAQEKLKECLEKNRIKITSFYGSFRVDQISIDDFLKGVKEAKGEELSTNDVKRMSQLMKQFFTLFNKLMREIYPVREERIKMRNEIDGIKEKQ